jgi:hypothetical protein
MAMPRHHMMLENLEPMTREWAADAITRCIATDSLGPVPQGATAIAVDSVRQGWECDLGLADVEATPVSTGQSLSVPLTLQVRYTPPPSQSKLPNQIACSEVACVLELYWKTVDGSLAKVQPASKLRRDLVSCLNEQRFYEHMAPTLRKAGLQIPIPVHTGAEAKLAEADGDASLFEARLVMVRL